MIIKNSIKLFIILLISFSLAGFSFAQAGRGKAKAREMNLLLSLAIEQDQIFKNVLGHEQFQDTVLLVPVQPWPHLRLANQA